jgi:hypothetical protein
MPIQIRELIVTATVDNSLQRSETPKTKAEAEAQSDRVTQDLIQTCVEEVLKVIKQQGRR